MLTVLNNVRLPTVKIGWSVARARDESMKNSTLITIVRALGVKVRKIQRHVKPVRTMSMR